MWDSGMRKDQIHDFDEALEPGDPVMAHDPVEIVNSDSLLLEWKSRRGQASGEIHFAGPHGLHDTRLTIHGYKRIQK
jgi:hypothetical protein